MKTWFIPSPSSVLRLVKVGFSRSAELIRRYQDLFTLCLVYGVARLFTTLFTQQTFTPFGPTIDLFLQEGRYSTAGAYPFIDYWAEYPPLFPWFIVAAYRLSTFLPSWGNPVMWFGVLMRWTVVPFEVGSLALVYALSSRCNPEIDKLRSVFMYAAAFVTLYVPLGWFDALPLFWMLLVLYFTLQDQVALTGISIGLGMLAKPITPLVLPAAWQRWTSLKARMRLVTVSLATFMLSMLPLFLLSPTMVLAHWRNVLSRPSWETVWALLDGYYGVGFVPPLEHRFDPGAAVLKNHAGGGYSLWAMLGFGLLGLFLWTRRIDWRNTRRMVAFVGLTWCLFTLWSKGYSPQWAINLIPFIALLLPNLRGAVYLGMIAVALLSEWPVAFVLLSNQNWYLTAVIIWRTALYILLALEFGVIALLGEAGRHWPKSFWAAIGVLIVSGSFIGREAFAQYAEIHLVKEPLREAIQVLGEAASPRSGLVCRDISTCERIAPYLPGSAYFWLPTPDGWQAGNLPAFAQDHPVLWLVEDADQDLAVENYLSEHYGKESQIWAGGVRLARFVTLEPLGEHQAQVEFGCCLRLISYAVGAKGPYLNLTLNWQATAPIEKSYKVFVHVYDLAGNLIAQNDQYPVGGFSPTNQWGVGQTVADKHGLLLPELVRAGYRISIGWYDPDVGQRLPAAGSTGDTFEFVVW